MKRSNEHAESTRRDFLQRTGIAVTAAAVSASAQRVHAGHSDTIQLALVGCGGRGTGAIEDAFSFQGVPTQLVAMADVFENTLTRSHKQLASKYEKRVDVPDDRRFIGFDGYRHAMDCLRPGDVVLLTTPPAFRWVHFQYALEKGLNVFMEKPVTVDGPTSRRMLAQAKEADAKNIKVAVGLMCRHCEARQQLHDRIADGEIGDPFLLRAYRMQGSAPRAFSTHTPKGFTELLWQVKQFHSVLWASGGVFSDYLIHNIDECCWMKNDWPVQAMGMGGRHYRGDNVDQNFDTYSIEYTFGDGTKLLVDGRAMPGCHDEFASYIHGTKGSAVISTASHTPARCRIYKSQRINHKPDLVWAAKQPEPNPYRLEWAHFLEAILQDRPFNELERGVQASLVTAMGRMAAHTGRIITYQEMLECDHEFAPDVDQLTLTSAAPLVANSQGKYPVPMPGITTNREYQNES